MFESIHRIQRVAITCLAVTVVSACEHETQLELGLDTLPPVPLSDSLAAYVDRDTATATIVGLADSLTLARVDVGTTPILAESRAGVDEVLVLSLGERGHAGVEPEPASLTALPSDDASSARVYTLGSSFNALAQSEDGRYAIAFYRAGATLDRLLFNPNEIAIVDLTAEPSESNPVLRTVRSFGGVPTQVTFSPELEIAGETGRRLAIVSSPAYVTLLDLDRPERSEITVRLTLEGDGRSINPSQFLFDPAASNIYIRGDSANDIYVLTLVEVPVSERVSNDFRPILNQLGAGRQPSDMLLYDVGRGPRLLVSAPGSQEVVVIDNVANHSTVIPLEFPAAKIMPYQGAAPGDPEVRQRALLLPQDGSSGSLAFLDLELLEERTGRNVEAMVLSRNIVGSIQLPREDLVLLVHSGATNGVSLLDVGTRTVAPIFAEVSLANAHFDAEGNRMWVAAPGTTRLGWLDLDTFHTGEVRLDSRIEAAYSLSNADGEPIVVVSHPSSAGWLTLLDAVDPNRDTATTHIGFLLTDLFDRSAS